MSQDIPKSPVEYRQWWSENTDVPYGYCWCKCGTKTSLAKRSYYGKGVIRGQPWRFVKGHEHRKSGVDYVPEDRGYKTPCWIWQLHILKTGYGGASTPTRRHIRAHVLFWERANGPVPTGLHLDHLCKQRACVNPDHLEPVTHAENIRRGDVTKLSMGQVLEIRALYAEGRHTRAELARMYGLSHTHVTSIVKHRAWRL